MTTKSFVHGLGISTIDGMKTPAPVAVACILVALQPAAGCGPEVQAAGRAARVALVFEPGPSDGVSADVAAAALDEARAIWRTAGVEIDAEAQGAPRLWVLPVEPRTDGETDGGVPLGALRFDGGQPERRIQVFMDPIEAVAAQTPAGIVPFWSPAPGGRDRIVARVLGRVIAHELGHYLLHSPAHAERGLMRARHSVRDFVVESRTPFLPTADERQRAAAAAGTDAGLD